MIDFAGWEQRMLSVDNLRLDRKNPRLVGDSALDLNQAELLYLLLDEADVRDIARKIQRNGFYHFVPLIVVKENRHFVVVEGNRRLAALKLLRNPELAPPSSRRFFTTLSGDFDPTNIEKINVIIAPSRAEASPVLYTIHANEAARPWERLMKRRFIAGQIPYGATIDDIANRFNVSETEVRSAVCEVLLLDLAQNLELPQDVKDMVQSRSFALSTLERIINTSSFSQMTGFKMNGTSFAVSIPEKQFKNVMKQIFLDIATKNETSRSLEKEDDRKNYLARLHGQFVDSNEKGSWTYDHTVSVDQPEPSEQRKPRKYNARQKLIPNAEELMTGNVKLDALLVEGQQMPVGTYKNAAALLLRTILQLAICHAFAVNGKESWAKNSNGHIKSFERLIQDFINCGDIPLQEADRKQLQRFISNDNPGYIHLKTMHDYVHDPYQQPEKTSLQNYWGIIYPIVKLLS